MAGKLNLDPQKIVDKELDIDFKGYNPDQVDHLLDEIIQDYQTYENMIADLTKKAEELERTNASLRAKLIEVEGKIKAQEDLDPISQGASNVDILKRLSRLERQVFSNNKKMVYVHEAVAGTYGVRGKSMLAPSAMMVVFVPAQLIRPGIER